jgi:hypothetical protein
MCSTRKERHRAFSEAGFCRSYLMQAYSSCPVR